MIDFVFVKINKKTGKGSIYNDIPNLNNNIKWTPEQFKANTIINK